MKAPVRCTVAQAMETITAGKAETCEGRGVNSSYLLPDTAGNPRFSVKVHCPERSSDIEFRRITEVDAALRGAPWYPAVTDARRLTDGSGRLVVVRPYVPGTPSQNAARHVPQLARILAELAVRAEGIHVPEELVGDYASPWLADPEGERERVAPVLAGAWTGLARAAESHLPDLRDSALRLTREGPDGLVLHHGDLHGRNLVLDGPTALTVIDWDEAGFARRPADAGKALWLSCRAGRGDFVLDPEVVRRFLRLTQEDLGLSRSGAVELARLGALWFLPRSGHVELLGRRDAGLVDWYLGWISRFWARFPGNLEVVADAAR